MSTHSPDLLKIKASATSAAVEVSGEGASRVTGALLDLISPFSNVLGWAGDHLSVARKKATLRAVKKAVDQLREEGITSGDVPPKLLLPWLEGSSFESESADNLTAEWAGLFVRAVKSSDAVIVSYIDTLRKLGKEEAQLLNFFATDTSPTYTKKFYELEANTVFSGRNPFFSQAVSKIESFVSAGDFKGLGEFLDNWAVQGMCRILFLGIPGHHIVPTEYFRLHEHAVSNLEHLGLIVVERRFIETGQGTIEIVWFRITKYAFDMMWACEGVLTGSGNPRTMARDKVGEEKNA